MEVIRFERWKVSDKDPNRMEYLGQRSAKEVFEELYEFLSCERMQMPCGIKDAPKELCDDSFVSLDARGAVAYLDAVMAA